MVRNCVSSPRRRDNFTPDASSLFIGRNWPRAPTLRPSLAVRARAVGEPRVAICGLHSMIGEPLVTRRARLPLQWTHLARARTYTGWKGVGVGGCTRVDAQKRPLGSQARGGWHISLAGTWHAHIGESEQHSARTCSAWLVPTRDVIE